MTDDLVAFLRARLDDDKQTALSVSTGPHQPEQWTAVQYRDGVPGWRVDGQHSVVVDGAFEKDARHIARHDPARVLREAEAKRRVLEQFETSLEQSKQFRRRAASGDETDAQKLQRSTESIRVLVLLKVVETLALAYRDHPDYRPEWPPDT